MDNEKQQHLTLLNNKHAEMTHMLNVTQAEIFTGREDLFEEEAQRFIDMYEKRESIIGRIKTIDIGLASYKSPESAENDKGFIIARKEIIDKIKSIAALLIEMDKKNSVISAKLSGHLKGNIKQIREGKDASRKYDMDEYDITGYYIDKKN